MGPDHEFAWFDTRFALLTMTWRSAIGRHPEQARRAMSKDARRFSHGQVKSHQINSTATWWRALTRS